MKTQFLLGLTLLWAATGQAQVNLDQPVNVGTSDHVFKSAVDPNVLYYIPIAINRDGDVSITRPDDDHMQARFGAGVAAENIKAVRARLEGRDVRFLRPATFTIDPKDATDIGPEFDPVLTPLGDLDLAGPMPYSLRIKRKGRIFGQSGGEKLFKQLFGTSGADNAGVIRYEFNALQTGKAQLVRSAVGVFVGQKKPPRLGDLVADILGDLDFSAFSTMRSETIAPKNAVVLQDTDTHCWESVLPGQYCVRQAR